MSEKEILWDKNRDASFNWDATKSRIEEMARCFNGTERSVLDIGAGKMYLKKILPHYMHYYPVDYKKRCKETIICNLNEKQFPVQKADVVFLSGILEYIYDTEWFIQSATSVADKIIIAYPILKLQELNIPHRRNMGWLNELSFENIDELFKDNQFQLIGGNFLNNNYFIACYIRQNELSCDGQIASELLNKQDYERGRIQYSSLSDLQRMDSKLLIIDQKKSFAFKLNYNITKEKFKRRIFYG